MLCGCFGCHVNEIDKWFLEAFHSPLLRRGVGGEAAGVRLYLLWRGRYLPLLHAACQTEGRGEGGEDGDNHVDDQLPGFFLVFGTHNINHLPQLLLRSIETKARIIEVYSKEGEVIEKIPCHREDRVKAFVNIMYGCEKF